MQDKPLPGDLEAKIKQRRDNIQTFTSERSMIEAFISRLYLLDPDLLVSHNLCGGVFELLLARIQYLKISHWSRIGRLKKANIPTKKFDANSAAFGGAS